MTYRKLSQQSPIRLHLKRMVEVVSRNVSLEVLILELPQHLKCCGRLWLKGSSRPPSDLHQLLAQGYSKLAIANEDIDFVDPVGVKDCEFLAYGVST